jgi:nitrogen regulatory protein P-II 1
MPNPGKHGSYRPGPAVSATREIEVGGMTVGTVRGRGKHKPAKLHAAKGSELFQPQFSDRYIITIIIPESKEDAVINILKTKGTSGKVFVSTISRAIDITTGLEGEKQSDSNSWKLSPYTNYCTCWLLLKSARPHSSPIHACHDFLADLHA